MAADDKKLVMDVVAWLLNVVTSVVIIFVNKAVMTTFKFTYASTICGLHFLSCAVAIWVFEQAGFSQRVRIPLKDAFLFSLVGSTSIGSANFSLLLNSVGFYQIAKLLLAPFVCLVEIFWLRKKFSVPVLLCIVVVLVGVAIVTVTDMSVNRQGLLMAIVFVVSSGMQQILCGHFQSKFKVSSHQLLANTSPVQAVILLVVGPVVDRQITGKWVTDWEIHVPGVQMLALSCAIAVAVNLSQFLCLGRFTATSFQVLGHAKTVLVLTGGWLLFKEFINHKQLAGIVVAVLGMVLYSYFSSRQTMPPDTKIEEAAQPLLPDTQKDDVLQRIRRISSAGGVAMKV